MRLKIRIGQYLSTIAFYLILPFYFLERIIRGKNGGWKEKFGFQKPIEDKKVIMLHGCSVGEIVAVEEMARKIKQNFPDYKLVITTSTVTGQTIAKNKLSQIADYITYFPFDIKTAVERFLRRIHPSVVLIAETEIWPCFAFCCKDHNIPLFIINGRISDLSYRPYYFTRTFFREVFKNYTGIYTQSLEDSKKFIAIGNAPERTEFMGNLKFGITKNAVNVDIGQIGYRVFLAGSTHKGENDIILETYKTLKQDFPDLKLLIAPRHMERVSEIINISESLSLKYGKRSNNEKFSDEIDIIILDTLGELKNMYAISHVAFIGGSFSKTGGHNPLEATIWEKPVFSGPNIFNFKDIYGILTDAGAAKVVNTKEELLESINEVLSDENKYNAMKESCTKTFNEQKGAADFVISKMKEVIE